MANDLKDPERWIPRELFASYCGEGSDALLAHYDQAKQRKNMFTMSFDALAVLALPAWLGYRRQWKIWATFTGLIAIVTVIEAFANITIPSGAFVGMGIALGMMARGYLLAGAHGAYAKLKREGRDDATIEQALRGRARKSVGLAFAGGLGSLLIVGSFALIAEYVAA
jgi:hypothetical protein